MGGRLSHFQSHCLDWISYLFIILIQNLSLGCIESKCHVLLLSWACASRIRFELRNIEISVEYQSNQIYFPLEWFAEAHGWDDKHWRVWCDRWVILLLWNSMKFWSKQLWWYYFKMLSNVENKLQSPNLFCYSFCMKYAIKACI